MEVHPNTEMRTNLALLVGKGISTIGRRRQREAREP
jgi:hypothetical protein